jgi:hypothetical protein
MPKQYISDVITNEEIAKWQNGNRILIHSQTGSGKSEFIKTKLYEYCKTNNKKILLLSNRILLKNQNIVDIGDKTDIIKVTNYQALQSLMFGKEYTLNELISPYDYIVFDEAHFMFADSMFNKTTYLLLPPIIDTPIDKILILVTATPQELLGYQDQYDFQYDMVFDYSYINNLIFYNKTRYSNIVQSIIKNIPDNEKILYFGKNAQDCFDLSTQFESSKFICSKANKLANESSEEAIYQIIYNSKFDCRILFSTCVLDAGVNIIDPDLKHIFIDSLNPISFIQSLGRKRIISDNDKINLYVRNYNNGNLWYIDKDFEHKLEMVDNYNNKKTNDFSDYYKGGNVDDVLIKVYIENKAKLQHYKTQKELLQEMRDIHQEDNYKRYICKLLNFNYSNIQKPNYEIEYDSLYDVLKEYVGKNLIDADREYFKNRFFSNIFVPKKVNYKGRGMDAINQIIAEDGLPFSIFSQRQNSGKYRNRHFWVVQEVE